MNPTAVLITCFSLAFVAGQPIPSAGDVTTIATTTELASPPLKTAINLENQLNILSKRVVGEELLGPRPFPASPRVPHDSDDEQLTPKSLSNHMTDDSDEEHVPRRPGDPSSSTHATHDSTEHHVGARPNPPWHRLTWNLDDPVTLDYHTAGGKGGTLPGYWEDRICGALDKMARHKVHCDEYAGKIRMVQPFPNNPEYYHAALDLDPESRIRGSTTLHFWDEHHSPNGPVERVRPKISDLRGQWEQFRWRMSNWYKPHMRIATVPWKQPASEPLMPLRTSHGSTSRDAGV